MKIELSQVPRKTGKSMRSFILILALFIISFAVPTGLWSAETPQIPGIVPTPKTLEIKSGLFLPDKELTIRISPQLARAARGELDGFSDRLREKQHIEVKIDQNGDESTPNTTGHAVFVSLRGAGEKGRVDKTVEDGLRQHQEAYAIEITEKRIEIIGADAEGIRWAFNTLTQFINPDGFPCLKMLDYPGMKIRALHITNFHEDYEYMTSVIDQAVKLKFNTLFLLINQSRRGGLSLSKHPEILPGAMKGKYVSQAYAKSVITYARNKGLRVIPGLPLASKTDQLFGRAHQNLLMNQETLNPEDEQAFKILFDIIDEVAALFDGEYMYIGGDEVYGYTKKTRQRVPDGVKMTPEQFAKTVIKINDYLKQKHIRAIMSADMLLNPASFPEFKINQSMNGVDGFDKIIDEIPKDIILLPWHYQTASELFPTMSYLMGKGFEVIGATWNDAGTIKNYASFAGGLNPRPLGMMATTWKEFGDQKKMADILALSAEAYWNSGKK